MKAGIRTACCTSTAVALLAFGCTSHRVQVEPIEVKPIHLTVDVNIKIDRELDQFFAFEERLDPAAAAPTNPTTPAGNASKEGKQP